MAAKTELYCDNFQNFKRYGIPNAFCFEVEANNRVEAEEKAKEYVDKYQADKFFECATNRVFKIIPTIEGDKE